MDSNSRVIQNQVQENDEHQPSNVDSQQVAHSEEKQHHDSEGKSVFNKMKAKARKIKDTIKKHGHNVFDHGHENHNEDHHSSDDHALDKDEDQKVHEVPTHEIENVRSPAPKVENLGKSEVNFEGTTVKGEETHHKPQVVDVSPTTEIDQNITTGQGKTFDGEEKSEKPNVYLEGPIGLEEDPPKYNQTEVTDLTGTGTAEIDIAPVEKSFERINVQDKEEIVTENQSSPAGTGSLDQFVPDLYTATKTHYPSARGATPIPEQIENLRKSGVNFGGTTVQGEEPHHEPRVVDVSPTTEINENITTDQDNTFVKEEKSEQPNVNLDRPIDLEEDSHGSGSIAEAYTPPEYHQTEVTDITGAGTKEIDITPVEKSFERMNVQDELKHSAEPKVLPNVTEIQNPPAATGSHNQFVQEISNPIQTEDPSAEIHDQFVTDFSTTAKTQYPSDGSHNQFDPETISTTRMNVQDELKHSPEPKVLPNVTETQYPPAATGSHNQFVPEISTPTQTEDPSAGSHDQEQYIPELPSEAKVKYPSTEIHDQFEPDFSTAAKTQYPSDGSQDQFDPETISTTRKNVQDELKHSPEPKVLPNVTETQYPSAATGSHNQFVPEISTPTQTEDPSAESHDQEQYIPELPSAAKVKFPSTEIHDQFEPDFSTAAKTQYPSDGSQDQFDPETISTSTKRDHKISEATEQTFNTTTTEIEEQPSYELVEKGEREDKELIQEEEEKSGDASNKSGSTAAEYGKNISLSGSTEKLGPVYGKVAEVGSPAKSKVSGTGAGANTAVETETENEVKEEKKGVSSEKAYLAEKLKPGEEDKALSEVTSEALKTPKEESKKDSGDEEPEKLGEESSVTSPEKGVVDKLKGFMGSWFGKSEENQSTQGDEGLSQSENSGVEVEHVSKAKGETRVQE